MMIHRKYSVVHSPLLVATGCPSSPFQRLVNQRVFHSRVRMDSNGTFPKIPADPVKDPTHRLTFLEIDDLRAYLEPHLIFFNSQNMS